MHKIHIARIQTLRLPDRILSFIRKATTKELENIFNTESFPVKIRFEKAESSPQLFHSLLPNDHLKVVNGPSISYDSKLQSQIPVKITNPWSYLVVNSFGAISFCLALEVEFSNSLDDSIKDIFDDFICPVTQNSTTVRNFETDMLEYLNNKFKGSFGRDCIPEASDHLILSSNSMPDSLIQKIMERYHTKEEINKKMASMLNKKELIYPGWGRSLIVGKDWTVFAAIISSVLICQQSWHILSSFENQALCIQNRLCGKDAKSVGAYSNVFLKEKELFSHFKSWFSKWLSDSPPRFRNISMEFISAWNLKEKEKLTESLISSTTESIATKHEGLQSQVLLWISFIQILTIVSIWADYLSSNSKNSYFISLMSSNYLLRAQDFLTLFILPASFVLVFLIYLKTKRI